MGSAEVTDTYEARGRFVEGLARRLLETVAEGKPVRARDAVKLASTIVSRPDVQLAELVLEGGPHQISRALELAGMVLGSARRQRRARSQTRA